MIETEVLVVGAGPVGLSLAGDLGWRGVRTLLVERTDGAIGQPKMDGVNVRTMEFCRRWGLTGAIRDCGYPKDYPQDMVYLTSFDGYELGREEFATPSGGAEERRSSTSPESRFRCPQNLFDPILQGFARSQPATTLEYRCHLEHFEDRGDRVVSTLLREDTGERVEVVSRHLVGCDGSASTVRRLLDVPMDGLGTLSYTTNVLFRCPGLAGYGRIRPGYRYIFVGPEGTWATVVAISGRDVWRLSIIGGMEPVERGEREVHAALERIIGGPLAFEILSIVPWVRRELVARHYRVGNVFLAGDAAHVTSPTGGFGMNLGIADAVDLSWKLEAVLRGWGGAGLLEAYEIERRPVAQRAVREASGNLLRTLSPGPLPGLLAHTSDGAKLRYEAGRRFAATMLREWYKLGIDLGYVYEGSPVVVPEARDFDADSAARTVARSGRADAPPPPHGCLADGTPLSASMLREWQRLSVHLALGTDVRAHWEELPAHEVMLYRQTARPGARAPHVWLSDAASTLDWFGRGFVLVDAGGAADDVATLEAAARDAGVPLSVRTDPLAELAERYGAPLTLVRPDGHVAWRGDGVTRAQARAVIDRIRGHAERTP